MAKDIWVVISDDDDEVHGAYYDREDAESIVEDHAYKMRQRAIEDLGQDDDGNPKDLAEADFYAGQNYPIWGIGHTTKKECKKADGFVKLNEVDESVFGDAEVDLDEVLDWLGD